MSEPACWHECSEVLRSNMAGMGVEITVSTAAPLVANPYVTDPFVCPHDVTYWIEPTSEQIRDWVQAGTP